MLNENQKKYFHFGITNSINNYRCKCSKKSFSTSIVLSDNNHINMESLKWAKLTSQKMQNFNTLADKINQERFQSNAFII